MNKTKGFPTRYGGTELVGDGWWSNYRKALPVAESGGIVIAYGQHGTGKTRMAYEIAHKGNFRGSVVKVHGIPKDIPSIYTTAVDFFMEIRDTYRQGSERSEKQVMGEFTEAPFLVIDEIQERGETAFEDRKLTAIVDARYRRGLPTMLISNYRRRDFAKTLSPAILDRIYENGVGIEFNWDSYRRKLD